MSGGHAVETSARVADRRRDLALACSDCSAAGRCFNPVKVRKCEFRRVMNRGRGMPAERHDVFTPATSSLFATGGTSAPWPASRTGVIDRPGRRLCSAVSWRHSRSSWTRRQETVVKPQAWADYTAAIALDPASKRCHGPVVATGVHKPHLWTSSPKSEVAAQHGPPDRRPSGCGRRWQGSDEQMPVLRALGRCPGRAPVQLSGQWESNDQIDMMFLGCAARLRGRGRAERKATNYLNTVERAPGRTCPVVCTLAEAVDASTSRAETGPRPVPSIYGPERRQSSVGDVAGQRPSTRRFYYEPAPRI